MTKNRLLINLPTTMTIKFAWSNYFGWLTTLIHKETVFHTETVSYYWGTVFGEHLGTQFSTSTKIVFSWVKNSSGTHDLGSFLTDDDDPLKNGCDRLWRLLNLFMPQFTTWNLGIGSRQGTNNRWWWWGGPWQCVVMGTTIYILC